MSVLPSSPAAYTAQSVASAAVASPQQPLSVSGVAAPQQPQQLPQPSQPQLSAQPQGLPVAQPPMMAAGGPGGPTQQLPGIPYGAVPPMAGGPRSKPRSRPPSGGMGGAPYDSKQPQPQSSQYGGPHKYSNGGSGGAPGGGYKPSGMKAAGYHQPHHHQQHQHQQHQQHQHQLPHHAGAAGSYVSHGATAAVGIGGTMQPLMFATYQQQPQPQPHGQYSQSQQSAPAAAAAGSAQQQMLPNGGAYPQYMSFGGQPAMGAGAGLAPGQPAMPGSAAAPGAEGTLRKVIKVSSKSNVKSVAGAISHTTRAGESPTLMATGSESVNQAVKAIAIARGYLAENKLDVSCQPVFRNQEKGAITFVLSKGVLRGKKPGEDDDIQQLRVARGSDPNSVAGSIANKVRNGERVLVQSIGAGSVDITVRAITLARRFLEGDAIDVCFRPEFIHVKLDEGERSAVKFTILAQQV